MNISYSVGKYRNHDTNRERWAVLQSPSKVWYFPKRYGYIEAKRLCKILNKETNK